MKKSIALVLSSGGSKGLAHIGVIKELERQGFKISSVSGSSIGSVIGGLYAMGKLDDYTNWVKSLNKKHIWGLMDFTISTNGLLKGNKIFEKMVAFIPDVLIENMKIPFAAVATDLLNEKDVVFKTGSFYKAIRSSVAIPSVFTSVKYEDTYLVDGGVLNPIPIDHVERKEGDILVVVNLYGKKKNNVIKSISNIKSKSSSYMGVFNNISVSLNKLLKTGDKKSPSYLTVLTATTYAMVHKLAKENIDKHQPEIVINIPVDSANTFDFHKADELIALGEFAAKEGIAKYKNQY